MQLKKLVISLFICLGLTGCSVNVNINPEPSDPIKVNETEKFQKEYSELNSYIEVNIPDDTKIHYASPKEVLDILTDGTGIIYFGRPTCPWCRNVIPVLASVCNKYNMVINYYNPGETKEDDIVTYMSIKNELSEYLEKGEGGEPTMYLPDIYFVKDGKVVGHKLGSVSSQNDPYTPLTDEQKNELFSIYERYIKEL